HNLALEAAARAIARRSPARALSLAGRIMVSFLLEDGLAPFLERHGLPKDQLRYDFHAGAFETAEMLALFPDKVRDGWQRLATVCGALGGRRRDSALNEGEGLGYFGAPALASRELGEAYVEHILDVLVGDMTRFLLGEPVAGLPLRWRLALEAMTLWSALRQR